MKEQRFAYAIILPAMIVVFGIVLFPLISTFMDSIKNLNIMSNQYGAFVGFENYLHMLTDKEFWATTMRTAYFTVVSVVLELGLGLMIALLLNEDIYGKRFLRAIIIIPWAVPTIVNGAMWKWIYHPEYGALNALLQQLHLIHHYESWLGTPWLALNMIIIADAWKMTPLIVIFFLAALQMRNKSLYEAAALDGAGILRRFVSITVPYLKPTILMLIVIRTMEAFKVFDLIYATTRGGPANGTLTLTYEAYLKAFDAMNYSEGATISYLIALMILILTFIYVKTLKSEGVE